MTDSAAHEARTPSEIDRIAEGWVTTLIDIQPDIAIWLGLPGRIGEIGDQSPAGVMALDAEARKVIAALKDQSPVDNVDSVTRTDLLNELELAVEANEAKYYERDINVIASPAQEIREVFDLMPTATAENWEIVAKRLGNVGGAVDGYIQTLRAGMADGVLPARRQVVEVAVQARKHADPLGFFFDMTGDAKLEGDADLPETLQAELRKGAEASADAYGRLAEFLETELAPVATEQDGVGRELYALRSRAFLGAKIDLDETYEWGREELQRMVEEQTSIANEIKAGASVEEAIEFLEHDQSRKLNGTDALQRWMQQLSDKAVAELSRDHFDIPEPVKTLECMIAPTQEGGIYYTGPSDDFSRPGRMWWSVPEGVTQFDTWREKTTVYHEGVPGHHLQIGQATYNRATLNTWRRLLAGTSGHAEGWALYAERLMQELGYLDDPADRLGMLDGQRMRAARVVLDIGVHLGKPRLDGEGIWDADYALEFMRANVNMNDAFVRFEVNRYLGWPGQAPSYKVGQRIWEQVRDAAQKKAGADFSFKQFHKDALDIGGVGLDTLKAELLK
jgi:uncharacterized protein (DUF885 family)